MVFLHNSVCPKSQFHGKCPILKVIRATSKGFRLSYPWTSVTWAVWIRERVVSNNRACLANILVEKRRPAEELHFPEQHAQQRTKTCFGKRRNTWAEVLHLPEQQKWPQPSSATSCNRRETWVEEYYVLCKECIEKRVTYSNEVRNGVTADTET